MYFAEFLIGVSAGCILLEFSKKRSFVTLSHPPIRGGGAGGGRQAKPFPKRAHSPDGKGAPNLPCGGRPVRTPPPVQITGEGNQQNTSQGRPPPPHTQHAFSKIHPAGPSCAHTQQAARQTQPTGPPCRDTQQACSKTPATCPLCRHTQQAPSKAHPTGTPRTCGACGVHFAECLLGASAGDACGLDFT